MSPFGLKRSLHTTAFCECQRRAWVAKRPIWVKHKSQYVHLLFFALAAAASAFGAFELAMMQASSAVAYAAGLRWAHVPLAPVVLSIVWFVRVHFDAGRLWLA